MLVFSSDLILLWNKGKAFTAEHCLKQNTVIEKGFISSHRCGCLCPVQWCYTESELITLQGNIAYCWHDRIPELFGDVQTVSLVLLQQQPSTGMQVAYWSISQCLLHYYLYSRHLPVSLPFFDPAAIKQCQRGALMVIKNLLPSFAFPAFAFPAKGNLSALGETQLNLSHLLTGLLVVVLTQHVQ